jgi:hypothetical protein
MPHGLAGRVLVPGDTLVFDLLKLIVLCFTLAIVALPVALIVALSLPRNSEFRQFCLRLCYWGVALLAVAYFAMPIDVIPDVLFPIGFADDLAALAIGYISARKAMRPLAVVSRN